MEHTSADAVSKNIYMDKGQETFICSFQWIFPHQLFFSEPAPSKITDKLNQFEILAQTKPYTWFGEWARLPNTVSHEQNTCYCSHSQLYVTINTRG